MVLELISELEVLFRDFSHLKEKIDADLLLKSLLELHNLAELNNVKKTVAFQVKALLFSLIREENIEDRMHHILYGPSGVGKSTVARSLANIFKALGILNNMKKKVVKHPSEDFIHMFNELYLHHVKNKYVPENVLKNAWKNLKTYFENDDSFEDTDIVICGRENFVASFAGQSAIKTFEFLIKNRGKCVIIEEAYLLWTGENDGYGMEALTVLNRFMEEHKSEIIIIMTGYKDLIENTIFKAQPGLKRRINCIYELTGYSPDGLRKVFLKQFYEGNWLISKDIDLVTFFNENYKAFPYFGGDTERFTWVCKMIYSSKELMNLVNEPDKIPEISLEDFELAFSEYCKNCLK